ncbi:hypothetical protein VF21_05302 [Pseudogymnoascus sp. 05NY08]|nr:hypothetical protein VF21_05302 [Pseudogymnoascus sp. 05NY08]
MSHLGQMTSTTPTSVSTQDSATSTPSPTATKLLALTTPFVQRPECASIWDLTTFSSLVSGVSKDITVLVSDAADERFASCQPPGWESIVPASRFSFSPAVCPSGWTYYNMAPSETRTKGKDTTMSTAYCCASGHWLADLSDFPTATMTPLCYREASIIATLSNGTGSTRLLTQGAQAHQAWHITWEASDTSTLTPSLPELTSNKHVPTWKPGEIIEKGMYDQGYGERYGYNEPLRLAERQLHFNINALCQVVAKSVQQSRDDITLFTKIAEAKIAEGGSY